jgi:hypothetical protein
MKCRMCDADYYIKTKKVMRTLLIPLTEEQAMLDAVSDKYGIEYRKIRPRFCHFCGRNLGEEEKTE